MISDGKIVVTGTENFSHLFPATPKGMRMKLSLLDAESRKTLPEDCFAYYHSPIGWIEVGGNDQAVTALDFVEEPRRGPNACGAVREAVLQIEAYFLGKLREFDIPIVLCGTSFQRAVWRRLGAIPFGRTASYRDIAREIENPRAVRAVGAANGDNPVSIMIPCHRVIGSNGALIGYGSGLWRKQWLLAHEGIGRLSS
jgi:methylated-DNA-[protein]-cysteine S-methyltransferase